MRMKLSERGYVIARLIGSVGIVAAVVASLVALWCAPIPWWLGCLLAAMFVWGGALGVAHFVGSLKDLRMARK